MPPKTFALSTCSAAKQAELGAGEPHNSQKRAAQDPMLDSSPRPTWLYDDAQQLPGRGDTMFLNALRPSDAPAEPVRFQKDYINALRTDDVPGAQARHSTRPTPRVKSPYNARVVPSWTRRPRLPVDASLCTGDLPGAQPNMCPFKTSRVVDPIVPRYQLPTFTLLPHELSDAVRHEGEVRDTLDFKGESMELIKVNRPTARNPLECRDIDGAIPRFMYKQIAESKNGFTPRETSRIVEQAGSRVLSSKVNTQRVTDPLVPVYNVPFHTTHPFLKGEDVDSGLASKEVGVVLGSTPRELHRDNREPQISLIRRDIAGACPQRYKGAVPFNIYDPPEVTPYRGHIGLECHDIVGAQPGTRKAGTWW